MTDQHRTKMVQDLYREEIERLKGLALYHGSPKDMVEDVVQEVWLQLMRQAGKVANKPPARVRAWLGRVVRGKVADVRRYRRRHPAASLDNLLEGALLEQIEWSMPAQDDRQALLAMLLAELQQQDEEGFRLLVDYYFLGLRAEEAAARWKMTVRALRCRISRLLQRLRKRAAKQDG